MELLQLIFFTFSYNFMNTGNFFNTILIYLFLKLVYKKNNIINSNLDPSMIIINFLNIFLHLLVYQLGLLISIMKQNIYCNKVITLYNNLNIKYISIKNKIIHNIVFILLKLGMSKMFNLSEEIKLNKDLKTNQDISNFLDGLLEKNK